jgi:hypothetical protein
MMVRASDTESPYVERAPDSERTAPASGGPVQTHDARPSMGSAFYICSATRHSGGIAYSDYRDGTFTVMMRFWITLGSRLLRGLSDGKD